MKFYIGHKQFYCGVDLHARSMYICIIDKERNVLMHRKIKNQHTALFLKILKQYKNNIVVAAESSFAWYWLADLCADNGIEFVLGHALYMKAIHGGKTKNDRIDSYKIALLIQSGMLPAAYVYPKHKRPLRDLLRRRLHFVRIRAELLGHIQITNYQANYLPLGRINNKRVRSDIQSRFLQQEVNKSVEADIALIQYYNKVIRDLETYIMAQARDLYNKELFILTSIKGVGDTIALTIMLETDNINRFPTHQKFISYSRLVKCTHESAGKKRGYGNPKIGNPYLKFAFSEAAVYAAKFNPEIKKYLLKLESKYGKAKAKSVLAHKLGIAVYYMLKKGTVFNEKIFLSN